MKCAYRFCWSLRASKCFSISSLTTDGGSSARKWTSSSAFIVEASLCCCARKDVEILGIARGATRREMGDRRDTSLDEAMDLRVRREANAGNDIGKGRGGGQWRGRGRRGM